MNTNKPSSKKSWIITIIVIIAAVIAYFYVEGGKPLPGTSSLSVVDNPEVNQESTKVFNLLNQIKGLRIDPTLFQDPGYKTLRDYSVPIPQDDVGRSNPFAPIPGFIQNPASSASH